MRHHSSLERYFTTHPHRSNSWYWEWRYYCYPRDRSSSKTFQSRSHATWSTIGWNWASHRPRGYKMSTGWGWHRQWAVTKDHASRHPANDDSSWPRTRWIPHVPQTRWKTALRKGDKTTIPRWEYQNYEEKAGDWVRWLSEKTIH